MDKIYINNLQVYAYHGVYQQEKDLGQKFIISVELDVDFKEAAEKDDLNKTVNYGEVCHELEAIIKNNKFDLIEKLADQLVREILNKYPLVKKVKVNVKKPAAPIGSILDEVEVETERAWHKVYIALGSNMGDTEKNISEAINKIGELQGSGVNKISRYYETKPVGYVEQDNFLNAVIEVKTFLTLNELMNNLLAIEKDLKRERIVRWGPRTIDLDILLYDDIVSNDDFVIIPHPRMHERLFVLTPLNEIAPNALHPLLNKRIFQLEQELVKVQELI